MTINNKLETLQKNVAFQGSIWLEQLDRNHKILILSKLVQAVKLYFCIWEVSSSNLHWAPTNPKVYHGFLQSLQANIGTIPQIKQ
jgi:hypothetical protein